MKMFLEEVKIADASDLASRLWNADETGFSLAIASGHVLAKRGSRDVHETGGGTGREYVTVLGCGSADGSRISPYILYKDVHLYKGGQLMAWREPCTVSARVDGWRLTTSFSGSSSYSSHQSITF